MMMTNGLLPSLRTFAESRRVMPALDVALAFVAFGLAYLVRYELQFIRPVSEPFRAPFAPYLPYAAIFAALLYVNYQGRGLYKVTRGRSLMEEIYTVINGVSNATVVLLGLYFLFQPLVFSRLMLIYVAVIAIILLSLARAGRRLAQAYLRGQGIGLQRVLIVGAGEVGQSVLRTMVARKELGYYPLGYVDDNPDRGNVNLGRVRGLGNLDNLSQTIQDHKVDLVVITLSWQHHARILQLVQVCRGAGAEVRVVPDLFQLNLRQVQVENIDGIPLLGVTGQPGFREGNRVVKRVIDLLLIALVSPVLLVIFALVALAIRLEGTGPIFYTQRRIGENGRPFDMIKFRSMVPNADALRSQLIQQHGQDPRRPKIVNDPRVTRVGQFIRATSIDELPQIINVLKGDMSIVGPRPPTPDEVTHYEPWHMQRLQITPGITGLWQISGRSNVPFDEMCLLDIYYIENWSVKLDMQIMMMTVPHVLLRHGAY
jgi:exopolysaccharide biosynthesis polyprenyl glycosylphosphotransferase